MATTALASTRSPGAGAGTPWSGGRPAVAAHLDLGAEVAVANEHCLRWRRGRHSWRHRSEGGFDARRYSVDPLAQTISGRRRSLDNLARDFIVTHHYARSFSARKYVYGLFDRRAPAGPAETAHGFNCALVGVVVFGPGTQRRALTNVFPELIPYVESLDLSRLVLLDEVPANAETWFLARAFEDLCRLGVRGVVSFSDPVPRITQRGAIVCGHIGTTYRAKGAIFTGRGSPRTLRLLPDGTTLQHRSCQKIRGGERSRDHAIAHLVGWGARPPTPGEDASRWLALAYGQIPHRTVRHPGNLRFAFPIAPSPRQLRGIRVVTTPAAAVLRPIARTVATALEAVLEQGEATAGTVLEEIATDLDPWWMAHLRRVASLIEGGHPVASAFAEVFRDPDTAAFLATAPTLFPPGAMSGGDNTLPVATRQLAAPPVSVPAVPGQGSAAGRRARARRRG